MNNPFCQDIGCLHFVFGIIAIIIIGLLIYLHYQIHKIKERLTT
jgi:hypothetical protein